MTFPDFFIRVALAIRRLTIYNQIKRSQDEVDLTKVALQLKELSENRMWSLGILAAVLAPLTRFPSVVPAAWVVFLLLLSITGAALCDRIHPDQLSTFSPGLFTLMHSIPGLCICGVLLAAMIRFSENKAVAIVQLLVFGAFVLVVLLSWKTDEEISAVDEERAAGSGLATAGVSQLVPEDANVHTDSAISGGVRSRMTVTASRTHTTLTPTIAGSLVATLSPSDSYATLSFPGVVDGASARTISPTASAAVASSASNTVLSNKSSPLLVAAPTTTLGGIVGITSFSSASLASSSSSLASSSSAAVANNPPSSPFAAPKTASGAAIIASSSAPLPFPSSSTTIFANEASSSRPTVTTPDIAVPAPAKLRTGV
ncbi:hypothetical protein D9758_015842 [Tetrapyrgos nigripes]|uniref:Uncharacterized protein n=1 Tax=Tetrapyrgos nigripes TaxID=182062 RepID=A0A8H5FHN5_9AGAR|nr:hypothetical protein D9758_015842 [Tetrapyrgos nigripes]